MIPRGRPALFKLLFNCLRMSGEILIAKWTFFSGRVIKPIQKGVPLQMYVLAKYLQIIYICCIVFLYRAFLSGMTKF